MLLSAEIFALQDHYAAIADPEAGCDTMAPLCQVSTCIVIAGFAAILVHRQASTVALTSTRTRSVGHYVGT